MEEKKTIRSKYSETLIFKALLMPTIYLIVLAILFVVLLKVGIGKIMSQRSLISQLKQQESVLADKVNILNSIQNSIKAYTDTVTVALPEKNLTLLIVSQIKNIQTENAVVITDLRVTNPVEITNSRKSVGITLKIEGEMNQIISFLTKIMNSLPIVLVGKISFIGLGERYSADIRLTTYWENPPTKISAVNEKLKKITNEDTLLLSKLQNMKQPVLNFGLPQSPTTRTNPFK